MLLYLKFSVAHNSVLNEYLLVFSYLSLVLPPFSSFSEAPSALSAHPVLPLQKICMQGLTLLCNICTGPGRCCATMPCTLISMGIIERRSSHRQSTTGGGKRTGCSASWRLRATTQVCLYESVLLQRRLSAVSAKSPLGKRKLITYLR